MARGDTHTDENGVTYIDMTPTDDEFRVMKAAFKSSVESWKEELKGRLTRSRREEATDSIAQIESSIAEINRYLQSKALNLLADGHAIYIEEEAKQILSDLDVPWSDNLLFEMHDEPNVFKGMQISPEWEGKKGAAALSLGFAACHHYQVEYERKGGRGYQGRTYAAALYAHLSKGWPADA